MHVTKGNEGRLDRSEGWGTQDSIELRWLIDTELGGSRHGAVGRMRVDRGGAQAIHRHPESEEASLVLSGSGSAVVGGAEVPLEPGNVVFAPAGTAHAIAAGEEPLDLIVVTTAPNSAAAGWEDAADSAGLEVDEQELDDTAIGFIGMHARWLVDAGICGADALVLGRSRFRPGDGTHELHRHPATAEFFIVLEGEGSHLDEDGSEVAVDPGDVALLGAGSWHGFRNKGAEEVHAIFGFLDVPSLDDAGYELP
jgi:quercetin dioxygenase-like cupin family protein